MKLHPVRRGKRRPLTDSSAQLQEQCGLRAFHTGLYESDKYRLIRTQDPDWPWLLTRFSDGAERKLASMIEARHEFSAGVVMSIKVTFYANGRGKARCAPDPKYPDGMIIDAAKPGEQACAVDIPYPAPECGQFLVYCETCRMSMIITAAGRPDDPKSVRIPCKWGPIKSK